MATVSAKVGKEMNLKPLNFDLCQAGMEEGGAEHSKKKEKKDKKDKKEKKDQMRITSSIMCTGAF